MTAYRALAIVPAYPSTLPPREHDLCPGCGRKFAFQARVRDHADNAVWVDCSYLRERFCMGGRHGFLWLWRCDETRPHWHQRCNSCGARWLAGPAGTALFER